MVCMSFYHAFLDAFRAVSRLIPQAAVLALAIILPPSPAAAQIKCANQRPVLSFSTTTAPTKYIRGISSENLTQMHGSSVGAVGGLGGGEIGFRTESRFEISQQGGRACLRLRQVAVELYARPAIHIASNFHRTSCEYNAVMAHERKHVSALLKFVREYSPKAHYEIARIVESTRTAYGPLPAAQAEALQQRIQAELGAKIHAYSDRIMPVLRQRQQAIDTPQEYARVAAQCNKWDQKLGAQ